MTERRGEAGGLEHSQVLLTAPGQELRDRAVRIERGA
jgi:hypothetical protein